MCSYLGFHEIPIQCIKKGNYISLLFGLLIFINFTQVMQSWPVGELLDSVTYLPVRSHSIKSVRDTVQESAGFNLKLW